jgi:hypothetical protein
MSTSRAVLIGAAAALVLVGAVVALALLGVLPSGSSSDIPAEGAVAVALVLPDQDGVVTLRVLDIYSPSGAKWSLRSVSPTTPAVVSGTSGTSLADAYSFGGGDALAEALSKQAGLPVSGWVTVDQRGWEALRANAPFEMNLASDIEVFDGRQLHSFGPGRVTVSSAQTARLLDGAAYLKSSESRDVRVQVGDVLRSSLASAGPDALSKVRSSWSGSALSEWAKSVGAANRVPGT